MYCSHFFLNVGYKSVIDEWICMAFIAKRLWWLIDVKLIFLVTKFIRIGIADKNDNPPYFDKALYEAEVDENEDIQHTVLTVTAKDLDECKLNLLTYFFTLVVLFIDS